MSFLKFGHAAVVNKVVCPGKWVDNVVPKGRLVVAKNVIAQFDPSKWLLSHCFTPGNLVLMADGTQKPIEQISIGDSVITHLGNIKKVTKVMSREISETIIKISSASLPDTDCTGEHPFYTIDKVDTWCKVFPSYAKLEKVKCVYGGKQQCKKHCCSTNGAYPHWKKAQDLKIGDRLYTPTLHETRISEDLNPNRMRLLGYYIAEGRVDIDQYKKLPHSIRFALHDNEMLTLGREICKLMEIEFGIKSHSILKSEKNGKGFVLAFSSFEYAPWFLKHAGTGSHDKKLSIEVVTAPVSWQKNLVGSWINGDGCYDKRGIRVVTASDDLCSQIVLILDRMEIHSTYQKITPKEEYRSVNIRGVSRTIKSFDGWHISIPNSYKHLLSGYTKWGEIENIGKKATKGRYRYAASTLSTIESIKKIPYKGLVFNFSVEDDESYIVNRQAVHNCTIMASVDVEKVNPSDPRKNFLIKPEYSIFVNNNGDSWERGLLKTASKTFLGADNFCFAAGTRVLMSDGTYKPIEEIKEGDRVINRKGEVGNVTKTFRHTADNLLEISGLNALSRSIFVTKEHPFWIYHARETCPKTGRLNSFDKDSNFSLLDKWVGFSVGVHRASGESFPNGLFSNWVEAGSLNPDRDFFTHPVSVVEISNKEINENRAELIGWFLAEGFYDNKNKSSDEESGVTFALGNDETDVAERLSDLLIKEFGDKFRVDCSPRLYEAQSGSYMLSISNAEVAKFFRKWCGKYAWAKKLSEEAMWLPKKLQAIILKHCINGDGCGEYVSRGYSLELKSRALIQQFNWISWRLGMLPTYREVGVLPRYTNCEIVDGYEVYTDPITNKKSRPGYLLRFSTRDSKKLNDIIGHEDIRIASRLSKKITHTFGNEEGKWIVSKIDSIKPTNLSCEVYNIEVDNDNSYIAEGVVVHNCEHVQIPELSKGKIIDVALREVPFAKGPNGDDLTTMYVDILIATNKKHTDLVEKIQTGEYSAVSMGCLIKYSICTQCGRVAEDESQSCKHVKYFKGNYFYDDNGIKRIVAELCGSSDDPESCKFIDGSWVRKPAFEGAVLNKVLPLEVNLSEKIQKAVAMPSFEYMPGMYLKAASQTAEDIVRDLNAAEGDAPAPEPPKDDFSFPEAPADSEKPLSVDTPPGGDMPSADAPIDTGAAPGGAGLGDSLGGGLGAPEPQIQEPAEDATVKEVKDMFKRQILNQIRREIMKDQAKQDGGSDDSRPTGIETDTNDNLVSKSATFKEVLANAKKANNDRLFNGLMILSNLKDWKQFSKYGYGRKDVLGLLHFIDMNISDKPVGVDAVKTLSNIRLGSDGMVPFFTKMIVEIGRKPSKDESKRLASWAKILSNFE